MKQLSLIAALLFLSTLFVAMSSSKAGSFVHAQNGTTVTSTTTVTASTAAPPTPAPSYPCESFDNNLANCGVTNTSCQIYNNTCRYQCYFVGWAGESACVNSGHCAWDNYQCTTKCQEITSALGCRSTVKSGSPDCLWYGGRCNAVSCSSGNITTCTVNKQCTWDSAQNYCTNNCALGVNHYTCTSILGCRWFNDTQSCNVDCNGRSQQACATVSHCTYGRTVAKNYDHCMPQCTSFTTSRDCTFNDNCMWTGNGTCEATCGARYDNQASCNANAACQFVNGMCQTKSCSAITDMPSCVNSADRCQVQNGNTCVLKCSAANSSSECPAFPLCSWSSNTCSATTCSNATTEAACSSQSACVWASGSCKMSCKSIPNNYQQSVCDSYSHCEFDTSLYQCKTKCAVLTTRSACAGANPDPQTSDCHWAGVSNKCTSPCSRYNKNSTACMGTGTCSYISLPGNLGVCTPYCDMATNATDCNSKFFASNCRWNYNNNYCSNNCGTQSLYEFNSNKALTCAGSCGVNTNFLTCVYVAPTPAPAPNTTTSTAAPNTTTPTPAPTAAPNTTSNTTAAPSPNNNTTAAPSTTQQQQQNATTSTAAPTNATQQTSGSAAAPTTSTQQQQQQTSTATPPPPTTTQQQQQQSTSTLAPSTTTVAPRQETTSEAPQQTTTQAPTPTKRRRNPRVQFVLSAIARARANTTAANFKALLAKMLSIPANAMTVEYDESSGAMLVEFKEDATDSSGNTLNATAEFEKAVTLDSSELSSLGAASVTSAEPAPAPENAPEEEKKFPVALVAGICGGFAFILIVILIIKAKAGSAGTGAAASAAANGDRPMLEVPQQQHQGRNTIDNEL